MDGFGRQKRMDRFGNQTKVRRNVSKVNDSGQNYRLDCCDDALDDSYSCNGIHLTNQSGGCCSCNVISYPMYGGQGFNIYYACHYTCVADIAACCGGGGMRAGRTGRMNQVGRGFRRGGRVRRRR